jgi:hypothetical protein
MKHKERGGVSPPVICVREDSFHGIANCGSIYFLAFENGLLYLHHRKGAFLGSTYQMIIPGFLRHERIAYLAL